MARTKTTKDVDEAVQEGKIPTRFYRVDAALFMQALNMLSEWPYNKCGDLVNALRGSKELDEGE